MAPKSTTLSELLHVCHLPACTAITMNPFLHQLNCHADHHSDETKLWLSKESAKRERVIFKYRNKENRNSLTQNDASSPKPSDCATPKKTAKKFGSLHTDGKTRKYSLFPSPEQSKHKIKGRRSSLTSKRDLNRGSTSPFMGIPELSAAVQATEAHFDRTCREKSHLLPDWNTTCKKGSFSPSSESSGQSYADPVKVDQSILPRKQESGVLCRLSDAETCVPLERNSNSVTPRSSESCESTWPSKKRRKNGHKQKHPNSERNAGTSELNLADSSDFSRNRVRRKTRDSVSGLSHNKIRKKSRKSHSFGSPADQDEEISSSMLMNEHSTSAGEIKREKIWVLDSILESEPCIQSSPSFTCLDDEPEIQIISVAAHAEKVPKREQNLPECIEILDSSDIEEVVPQSSVETSSSLGREGRIKSECSETLASPEPSSKCSPLAFDKTQANATTSDMTVRNVDHKNIPVINQLDKQLNNSDSSSSSANFTNAESPPRNPSKVQPPVEIPARPKCESDRLSIEKSSLYLRENLSYNFVMCDYVVQCLAHCKNDGGRLTKETAASVQQVLLVLLFLRGAKLEFLSKLCVCCVMKTDAATHLGTIVLKPSSGPSETLELSVKEFRYLVDFVRNVRPVLCDSIYGTVFVEVKGAPFSLESLRQAISLGWNLSETTVELGHMLRIVGDSYRNQL